jgi:hypothetical protein
LAKGENAMLTDLGAVSMKTKGTIFFILLEGGIFPLLAFR